MLSYTRIHPPKHAQKPAMGTLPPPRADCFTKSAQQTDIVRSPHPSGFGADLFRKPKHFSACLPVRIPVRSLLGEETNAKILWGHRQQQQLLLFDPKLLFSCHSIKETPLTKLLPTPHSIPNGTLFFSPSPMLFLLIAPFDVFQHLISPHRFLNSSLCLLAPPSLFLAPCPILFSSIFFIATQDGAHPNGVILCSQTVATLVEKDTRHQDMKNHTTGSQRSRQNVELPTE
ncbi:unnamed protein product [Schistocephalus solidus]|uniref:Uncharacterized protein n=1 Tax=Schistocephalus solidus TaxID=70667 RepID=A0A183T5C6_SCHSO|nr:unnamed protein product [Schistocephalus solidus]